VWARSGAGEADGANDDVLTVEAIGGGVWHGHMASIARLPPPLLPSWLDPHTVCQFVMLVEVSLTSGKMLALSLQWYMRYKTSGLINARTIGFHPDCDFGTASIAKFGSNTRGPRLAALCVSQ
jgi:hypothetical protein